MGGVPRMGGINRHFAQQQHPSTLHTSSLSRTHAQPGKRLPDTSCGLLQPPAPVLVARHAHKRVGAGGRRLGWAKGLAHVVPRHAPGRRWGGVAKGQKWSAPQKA